jgi:hypothetical protein
MPKEKTILIKEYLHKVKAANKELTKKEAFKDLLNRLYAGNAETESIIDKITLGAEKTIVNIPRKMTAILFLKIGKHKPFILLEKTKTKCRNIQ